MAVRKTAAGLRLKRWFKEDWRTPKGKKGYKGGENTFRPTKRITKDTPTTWSELSPGEKRRAQKEKDTKAGTAKATKWLDTWDGGETKTQGKIEVQFWDFYGDKYMWLDYGLPQWWGPLSDISIGRINTDNQLIKTKYSKSVIGRRNIILKLLSFMNKKDKKALKSKKYDEKPWNS